jgi:hypothetical protein
MQGLLGFKIPTGLIRVPQRSSISENRLEQEERIRENAQGRQQVKTRFLSEFRDKLMFRAPCKSINPSDFSR